MGKINLNGSRTIIRKQIDAASRVTDKKAQESARQKCHSFCINSKDIPAIPAHKEGFQATHPWRG